MKKTLLAVSCTLILLSAQECNHKEDYATQEDLPYGYNGPTSIFDSGFAYASSLTPCSIIENTELSEELLELSHADFSNTWITNLPATIKDYYRDAEDCEISNVNPAIESVYVFLKNSGVTYIEGNYIYMVTVHMNSNSCYSKPLYVSLFDCNGQRIWAIDTGFIPDMDGDMSQIEAYLEASLVATIL